MEIQFPVFGESPTVKNSIINVLIGENSSSAKRIYSGIRKRGHAVSYQAVHKALRDLLGKGVLVRTGREYMISSDWADRMHEFGQVIKNRNMENGVELGMLQLLSNRSHVAFEFRTLLELDEFNKKLHDHFYPRLQKDFVCMYYRHQWWHLLYPQKGYPDLESNRKFYMLCSGNTLIDRHGMEISKTRGFNTMAIKSQYPFDLNVYQDLVISIHYGKELYDAMENEFGKVKSLEELHVPDMVRSLFSKESKITVLVNRNRLVADLIRQHTLALFGPR